MMRKGLVKRLTKSATDISGCKKKSHSTSPEEENKSFGTPRNLSDDESCCDDEEREGRPRSAQSTSSVPGTLARRQPKAGFLTLLRRRLHSAGGSRGSSRDASADGSRNSSRGSSAARPAILAEPPLSPQPPEIIKRRAVAVAEAAPNAANDQQPPEIVRFKCSNNNHHQAPSAPSQGSGSKPEVIRHHVTPMTSLNRALAHELEAVRKKEEHHQAGGGEREAESGVGGDSSAAPVQRMVKSIVRQASIMSSGRQSSVAPQPAAPEDQHTTPSGSSSQCDSKWKTHQPRKQASSGEYSGLSPPPGGADDMTPQTSEDRGDGDSYHSASDAAAEHLAQLRAHSFFLLHVHLKQGYDLAAKDTNGFSDPYVKFFLRGHSKAAHKSKTIYKDLNPLWDERFVIPVEDAFLPLDIKVRM